MDEVGVCAGGLVSSYLLDETFLKKKQTFCFNLKNKRFTFAINYGKEKNYREEKGGAGYDVIPSSSAR